MSPSGCGKALGAYMYRICGQTFRELLTETTGLGQAHVPELSHIRRS